MTSIDIIRGFWAAMATNDFDMTAETWLAPDFVGLWPQTAEVIYGPEAFARVNNAFPGRGDWRFEEISLLAEGARAVTDIRITNAPLELALHCLTFHEIRDGRIVRQTEYWPDTYPVPKWREGLLSVDAEVAKW